MSVFAAELIMFRAKYCEWCEVWDKEVGIVYAKTKEANKAKLRMVNIHAKRPADLADIKGVVFTPTFILFHEGKEIGRMLGYVSEDFFWGQLEQLLNKLPTKQNAKN